ncbi:glycoside hydrolase family 16 protein [Bradyrhizobium sp. 26S5]|uniref:glycoside hydrolase family 16 protein n=1 Tax=Bradyrhizobium sp. 26S5 TaxID=3139729 RepID=UPI0030CF9F95
MALAAPAGFTSSNLVYQDSFSSSLDSDWHTYITSRAANGWAWNSYGSGGSGPGGAYDADYDMPSQVTVSNGLLNLTAAKQTVTGMNQGSVQSFPITSGAVSSYGNFEFNGGYLQISMKAPSGNGAWPGLWLMPGAGSNSGDNFEIDIQEGGYTGSGPANQAFSWHLHSPSGTVGGVVDTGVDLTAGFHTYGINWVPGQSITWYLDGRQIATVTSAQAQIPNQPMQLIMSNQVANSNAAGWHTALDGSTPSTMQMQIDEIQLYRLPGSAGSVTGANVSSTSPPPPTQPTTPAVTPTVTSVAASPGTGIEHVGDSVTLTLAFNEAVNVVGKPTLTLNDGSTATYVSGSGTSALTFRTTVASTNTATSALAVTGVSLAGGASIRDASGVAANLAGAVKTFAGLQIDPTSPTLPSQPTTPAVTPAVTQVVASPGTGVEHVGDSVTLSLAFNEAVNVVGKPTLTLNDGSTATYVGGSGTSTLTFRTTVASTNTATSALAVTGVSLAGGASIRDASGVAANLAGAVKTFAGLQIDPTSPTLPSQPTTPAVTPTVTQVVASPGTGVEHVGDAVTFTLGFNEAVNVAGKPTLSLNDGSTATYVSGSGTSALTFRTTVASTDLQTSALAITGVNLPSGASISDAGGAAANLAGAVKTFAGLQISPSVTAPSTPTSSVAPVLMIADTSLSVDGRGGTVDLGVKVATTDPNDAVTVTIKGLPRYETITDNLDGRTYKGGRDITLTAAQVESGLTLQSNYRGSDHPVATLSITATATDPSTGSVTRSASQSITVTDPPPASSTMSASANLNFAVLSQYLATHHGSSGVGQLLTAVAQGGSWNEQSYLSKPQH